VLISYVGLKNQVHLAIAADKVYVSSMAFLCQGNADTSKFIGEQNLIRLKFIYLLFMLALEGGALSF